MVVELGDRIAYHHGKKQRLTEAVVKEMRDVYAVVASPRGFAAVPYADMRPAKAVRA